MTIETISSTTITLVMLRMLVRVSMQESIENGGKKEMVLRSVRRPTSRPTAPWGAMCKEAEVSLLAYLRRNRLLLHRKRLLG
jgi:hypothetical protein